MAMQINEEPEPENQKTDEKESEEVVSPTEEETLKKNDDDNDVPWEQFSRDIFDL